MTATPADVERRLFEVLGAWAPEAPEPEVKLFLRMESFRHARHAETAVGGEGGMDAVAALLEDVAAGPRDSVARLTGVYRLVLPALIAAVDEPEHEAARQEGEQLLANLSVRIAHADVHETP